VAELVTVTRCDICGKDIEDKNYVEVKIWKSETWTKRHDVCINCVPKLPEYIRKEHMKHAKD